MSRPKKFSLLTEFLYFCAQPRYNSSLTTISIFITIFQLCVCICACQCSHLCSMFSSISLHLLFWNRVSLWLQTLIFLLSWLASQLQASCGLYHIFPRFGLQTHTPTHLAFKWGWRSIFVSSCLHSKHCICWAVSQWPNPTFTCYWSSLKWNKNECVLSTHARSVLHFCNSSRTWYSAH